MYDEEMDLSDYTPDNVEKTDGLPPGWYRATIKVVSIDERSGALLFRFEVMDGEHEGSHISERLWDPKRADSPDKADMSRKRRVLWAKRLGLLAEADFGKPGVVVPWDHAVDRVYAIQVKERKYKDSSGTEKVAYNIDFGGVYSLDDQRVPEELRGEPGAAFAGTAAGTPANGKKEADGRKGGEDQFAGL